MSPLKDQVGRTQAVWIGALDITEQYGARQRLTLLNEAGTHVGTTLDVTRTAQELADMVVPRLADLAVVDLLDAVLSGDEPRPGPLTGTIALRRVAHQSIFGGVPEAVVEPGDVDIHPESFPSARCLATGKAVLTGADDPAFIWSTGHNPARAATIRKFGIHSVLSVPIRARGVTLGVAVFLRGRRPEPFEQDDVLLAEELTARAALSLDNARRYTRERTTALALQRSLLPQRLPRQSAVEVASRYLPASAHAGVGGDWFDVIPLSGARVALVVGDVVGHGIHASATMGRLRTAVRTLADVDLPPDELLTRLDDLVSRLPPTRMPMTATTQRMMSAPPACTRSTIRSPAGAAWPGPAIRCPRSSPRTAPPASSICPPARRSVLVACPSRAVRSNYRPGASSPSTPTASSSPVTTTSTSGLNACAAH